MKMNWLTNIRSFTWALIASGFLISASLTSCGGDKGKENAEGSENHEHPEERKEGAKKDSSEHPEGNKEEHPEGEKEEHPDE